MTEDKIMLSLSDINILGYDTPISIHLSVADIIGEFPHGKQLDVKQDQLGWSTLGPSYPYWTGIEALERGPGSLAIPTIL